MTGIPIQTLQKADKLLGLVACSLLQPARLSRALLASGERAPRVLLIKFWGIGSLQLLTPAVRALRAAHPGAELALLTLAENARFARGLGVFDRVRTLDVAGAGWVPLLARIGGLVRALRRERFAAVYDFEFFTRFSSVVSLLTGAPRLAGFASPTVWRGRFHTHTVPFNRYWHVARNFRALAGGEDGCAVEHDALVPYRPDAADEEELARVLAEEGLDPAADLVVLNPNAGTLSLERRWPAENFAALAGRLEARGLTPVLVGAAGEREYTARVAAMAERPPVHLAGRLSIGALCALFGRAAAVVSNDSGPMHLAAALGAPTLGLFGPETPVMYAPLGAQARYLWAPPVCSPCINVHDNKVANCKYGRPECLVNLTVERVEAELERLMRGPLLRPVRADRPSPASAPEPKEGLPSEAEA